MIIIDQFYATFFENNNGTCTYDNVRMAESLYIVNDIYEKVCNCVRINFQFRHSNENNSTRICTRV